MSIRKSEKPAVRPAGRTVSIEPLEGRRLFAASVGPADLAVAVYSATFKELKNGLLASVLKVSVTNDGPGTARGTLQFTSTIDGNGSTTDGIAVGVPFKPAAAGISLAAGKTKVFTLKANLDSDLGVGYDLAAGTYDFEVSVGTAKMKSVDPNATNNVAYFTGSTFTIATGDTLGSGSATFAHFHKSERIGAGGYFSEMGTVEYIDGSSASYTYLGEKSAITLSINPDEGGGELYSTALTFTHIPKSLAGKTMTLSTTKAGSIGTIDVPDNGIEPLDAGIYYIHLT